MSGSPVSPSQRFRRDRPCPVCGGWDNAPRGRGERCYGYLSDDGAWAHCTREELAGGIAPSDAGTFGHRLEGPCKCGREHGAARVLPHSGRRQRETAAPGAASVGALIRHIIRGVDGRELAHHCRQALADGTKRVWWERPGGFRGLGARSDDPDRLRPSEMLYGAERLTSYNVDRPLILCEGEPATDAVLGLGLQAVGTVTGAGTQKAPKSLGPVIAQAIARFRRVVVWPDNDDEGRAHMVANARALERVGVAELRLLRWPEAPAHGDAADFAVPGRTGTEALALVVEDQPARIALETRALDVPTARADAAKWERVEGTAYYANGTHLAKLERDGEFSTVLSWLPEVLSAIVERDLDGRAIARAYELRVGEDVATVTLAKLNNGEAWECFPASHGTASRPIREALTNYIAQRAQTIERVVARYTETGFHLRGGEFTYLRADGSVIPEGARATVAGVNPALAREAAPPEELGTQAQAAAALGFVDELAARTGVALLTVGAVCRSLCDSIAPSPTSVILEGDTRLGKTGVAALAIALVFRYSYPPRAVVSLLAKEASTASSLEYRLGPLADSAVLLDDDATQLDASEADLRDALGKLERLLRPRFAHLPVRGRMTDKLEHRRDNYVRSIPIVTLESLPPKAAASLLYRGVILEIGPGDVALDRLRAPALEGEKHAAGLRWIGESFIRRVIADGPDRSAIRIRAIETKWRERLGAALVGAVIVPAGPVDIPTLTDGAAPLLTGIELACETAGLDPEALAAAALPKLVAHLVAQAERIDSRATTAGDVCSGVGDLLRGAMLDRRAHTSNLGTTERRPEPDDVIHGATLQEQGLSIAGGLYAGQGVPLFYVAEHHALGIRPEDFRALVAHYRDRFAWAVGLGDRALESRLAKARAIIPNWQAGPHLAPVIKVGGIGTRLLLVPEALVWPSRRDPGEDAPPPSVPPLIDVPPHGPDADGAPAEVLAWAEEYRGWWAQTVEYARAQGMSEAAARDTATRDIRERLDEDRPAVLAIASPDGSTRELEAIEYAPNHRGTLAELEESEPAERERDAGPSARRARPSSAPRAASEWYANVATDGRVIVAADGTTRELGTITDAGELAAAARALVPGREVIVWVHERAAEPFALPERLPAPSSSSGSPARIAFVQRAADRDVAVRDVGASGWAIAETPGDSRVHLAFPMYSGDFARTADAVELLASVERFRDAVGFAFAFSGPATLHNLIRRRSSSRARAIAASLPEPVLSPAYAPTVYAVQAHAWARELDESERSRSWVRAFDRSGSYLASWNGCVLSEGGWTQRQDARRLERNTERAMPAGYFRVAVAPLVRALAAEGLPDPFARQGDASGEAWLTAPLAQLAAELAEERGIALDVIRSYEAADKWRALDPAAARLSAARAELAGDPSPAATRALVALKDAYAGAVAWLEYGPRVPAQLARPHWRRTILDRTTANTWRALRSASPRPFALAEVDTALFALDAPDAIPTGLRIGRELGAWSGKGGAVPMIEARGLLASGGPLAILRRLEEHADHA